MREREKADQLKSFVDTTRSVVSVVYNILMTSKNLEFLEYYFEGRRQE